MRVIVVLILLAGVATAQPAQSGPASPAQTPPNQPSDVPPETPAEPVPTPALIAFQQGRALVEAGDYATACAKFTESIKLDPDAPGTLLNLGLCNEKLGKTATALAWYRKAQFRSSETQMADYETAAKQQTIVLAPKVPTLHIDTAAGATVTLDGSELSEIERARVEVDPGTHVIESGTLRRTITIHDGDKQTIDLRPPPVKRYVVVDHGALQRRYAYIAVGGGAVLYVASATLSLVGKHEYDATEHPETYQRWRNIVRYGGSSLFLAGSAAIAGGVYLYVKAPRAERVIAPTLAPDQLGVAIAGSF